MRVPQNGPHDFVRLSKNCVNSVHGVESWLECSFSSANNQLADSFNVVSVGSQVYCEDRFKDFGSAGLEVVAFIGKCINLPNDIFVYRDSKLLFRYF